jgi:uncharacterized protein (DUF433 family)
LRFGLCDDEVVPVANGYVEVVDGVYRVAGSRVSLDSVVCAFLRGESPEGIAEGFPALVPAQVFGALAYYLDRREEVDAYLAAAAEEFDALRKKSREMHPGLYAKLDAAREARLAPRG